MIAPRLAELKSRPCSNEELQAALIELIEHHNGLVADINQLIANGQIRSRADAIMNQSYGL